MVGKNPVSGGSRLSDSNNRIVDNFREFGNLCQELFTIRLPIFPVNSTAWRLRFRDVNVRSRHESADTQRDGDSVVHRDL